MVWDVLRKASDRARRGVGFLLGRCNVATLPQAAHLSTAGTRFSRTKTVVAGRPTPPGKVRTIGPVFRAPRTSGLSGSPAAIVQAENGSGSHGLWRGPGGRGLGTGVGRLR